MIKKQFAPSDLRVAQLFYNPQVGMRQRQNIQSGCSLRFVQNPRFVTAEISSMPSLIGPVWLLFTFLFMDSAIELATVLNASRSSCRSLAQSACCVSLGMQLPRPSPCQVVSYLVLLNNIRGTDR